MAVRDTVGTGAARLAGKRALLTGAAGGIAQACALRFVQEGARVALSDLDGGGAQAAADAVKAAGGEAHVIPADVTDADAVAAMTRQAAEALGGLDILVTCAGGYTAYAGFEDIEPDDWDRVIALNLTSVFLCCRAALPFMKKGGWGRVVNLGSLAGRSTSAGTSPAHYAAAKAGVAMMTQYLAKDAAAFGITANTVAPGTTRTERVDKLLTPDKREAFLRITPAGRLAEPEDIAGLVVFLASDESAYITGTTIDVNGGRLMLV